jgi:acetyl esterase/lipase
MRWNHRILATLLAPLVLVSLCLALLGSSPALACEPKTPVPENKTESPKIPAGLRYLPDQVYCIPDEDTPLMLDVLRPKAGNGPLPAVICLHGGGWVNGTRKTNLPIMIKLAQAGYVAVSVQYRLAKEAPLPAAVHDVKCAVRWLRANAGVFNVDPDRFAALGYSSGGTLACLLGQTTPLDGLEGEGGFPTFSSRVQAVVSYSGISDLAAWQKDNPFFSRISLSQCIKESSDKAEKLCGTISPITHARGDKAAVLLMHGTKDPIVAYEQSVRLHKRLQEEGARVRFLPIESAGHILVGDEEEKADADAIKFLDEMLRPNVAAKDTGRREP